MEYFSVIFYHPEKGFLWGINKEGKYDCMTGVWSDEYDPVLLINTLLNGEMLLYEYFYKQRRFENEDGGVSYELELMRRKYVDLEEEMYQVDIWMDGMMRYKMWEWFMKSYKVHTFDVGNHRYILLDISLLEDKRDEDILMNFEKYYKELIGNRDIQKEMVKWEWRKLSEIRTWKVSDVVCEIRNEIHFGLC